MFVGICLVACCLSYKKAGRQEASLKGRQAGRQASKQPFQFAGIFEEAAKYEQNLIRRRSWEDSIGGK